MEQISNSLVQDEMGATQISEFVPEKPEPSFAEKTKVAFEETTIGGAVERELEYPSFESNPNYWEQDGQMKSEWYLGGLTQEGQEYVAGARSDEEAEYRREQALKSQSKQAVMDEAGFTGMILPTVAAALFDPASYVYGIGELKALATLGKMSLGGKVAAGAVAGGLYEVPQVMNNINADSDNILYGAAFGGLLTPLASLIVDGKQVPSPQREDVLKELKERPEAIKQFEQETSVGAAQVEGSKISAAIENESEEELLASLAMKEVELDEAHTAPTQNKVSSLANAFMDKIDVSLTGTFKRSAESGNAVSSWVSKAILSDASGKNTRGLSAAAEKHNLDAKYTGVIVDIEDTAFNHIREKYDMSKLGARGNQFLRIKTDEFYNDVYAHMNYRFQNMDSEGYVSWLAEQRQINPRVVEAADALDAHYSMVLNDRRLSGEAGFKTIEHRAGYLPRIMDNNAVTASRENAHIYYKLFGEELNRLQTLRHEVKINKLTDENEALKLQLKETADADEIVKLKEKLSKNVEKIKESRIKMDSPDAKAKSLKAGKTFYDNLVRSGLGFQSSIDDIVNTTDIAKLTDLTGDRELAQELMDSMKLAKANESKSARAKARINFDVNKSTTIDGKQYSLSDLYTRNIPHLTSRYGREAAGRVALSKRGITSQHAWQQVSKLAALQEPDGKGADMNQKMEDIFNMMLSRPIDNAMHKGTRRLNEYVNLIMLGKTGIAQTADLAMITANNGFVNTVKSIKAYRNMEKLIKEGKADQTMIGQLGTLSGRIGQDHILFNPTLDRIGENLDNQSNKFWDKYDEVTGTMSNGLYYLNGMNHIKAFQQKISTISGVYNVVDIVGKGKDRSRLLSMGYSNKTLNALKKEIEKGTVEVDANGTVQALNLPQWGRVKDAQDFAMQHRTAITHNVQEPLIGEGVLAMQKDVGALMLKLMAFPLLAMQKQLSRSIYHHDMTSLALFSYGTMAGMSVYTLNQMANSVGNENKDIEEIFDDPYKIFMGGAMYNPLAGILPDFANGMAALGLLPQEFSPSGALRGAEGLTNGPSVENVANMTPVTKAALAPMRALSLLPRALAEGGVPDRAAYDLQAATPLGNTMLLGPFFNALKEE